MLILGVKKKALPPSPKSGERGESYDGVVFLSAKENCPIPGKPPRTFEQDIYNEEKEKCKEWKTKGKVTHAYEEIDESALMRAPQPKPQPEPQPKPQPKPQPPSRNTPALPPRTDPPPRSDDKFVRVPQRSRVLPPTSFVGKPNMVNPNYDTELSPGSTTSSNSQTLDYPGDGDEYATPTFLVAPLSGVDYRDDDDVRMSGGYSDPLDQLIPIEMRKIKTGSVTSEGIVFDSDGYASPIVSPGDVQVI